MRSCCLKVKVKEIAEELGLKNKDVIDKASEVGIDVKAANSSMDQQDAENLMKYIMTGQFDAPKKAKEPAKPKAKKATPTPKKDSTTVKKSTKTTSAKKETTEEKPKKVAKKEVVKKELDEPKEEKKEEKPSLAKSIVERRGLLIVNKKKKPKEQPKPEKIKSTIDDETVTVNAEATKHNESKKLKKKKQPIISKEKQSTVSLDINRDLAEINFEDENEVVLHTFDQINEEANLEEEEAKKPSTPKTTQQKKKTNNNQKRSISRKVKKKKRQYKTEEDIGPVTNVTIPEEVRVYEFADALGKSSGEIIKVLFTLGMMVTKNDFLDKDSIEILAEEFGVEVTTQNVLDEIDYEKDYEEGSDEDLTTRPPVITIMGHVDHGKTSLLDKIRFSQVASGEHGGITQHIGAYSVNKDGRDITFLDTPGHEAFTAMRARGASATDIVVIVVAADDGVKPQTKEAIQHAKAGDVPFVVAINKIDKPDANPDLAKSQLAELGVTPIDWGGDIEFVPVSAHSGEGIDELLEVLLLQADILELKANDNAKAKAVVVESSIEKGRGPVATIIVENGVLKVGDTIVCGVASGKVRAMLDENKKPLKEVKPGFPAVIVGLNEVPDAGDMLLGMDSDKEAREYANKRQEYLRQKELSKSTKVTLDELSSKIAEGQVKTLPVLLKADVAGSLEAIKQSLEKIHNEEVKVQIIHSDVGGITENDLNLVSASENAIIVGFQVRPTGSVKQKAKDKGITINTYNVIYDLLDDVKGLLGGLLSPVVKEEYLGQAEVRDVFKVPKIGLIAGCMVTDGVIKRGASIRVIRDGVVIYDGEVSSLKRFKDDAKEVAKGFECGIGVEGYDDVKAGDFLESFKNVEEAATFAQ
jgi:translation initiation factor IF-2